MKVISTNLSQPQTVHWKGKSVQTGIFKQPVDYAIQLGIRDVMNDTVVDRKFHGGIDKACYLYSADHYHYWKGQYPAKELPYGMFGENLTLSGLDENQITVGSQYQLGTALVEVSEPRQPCFKLGIRFQDQGVLKKFINTSFCGVYLRVLKSGFVQVGDEFVLIKPIINALTIAEVFTLIYAPMVADDLIDKLKSDQFLPSKLKSELMEKFG